MITRIRNWRRPQRRIRVLHVLNSLEPGGLENGVVNVANRLCADEFDPWFCCLENGGAFVKRLRHPDHVIPLHREPGFSMKTVLRLAAVIRRIDPDVIHSHNLAPLIYSAMATGMGVWRPLLQGEHGVFAGEHRTPARIKLRRTLYRGCARVQTVSDDLRDWMIDQHFDASKIVSVVNGVDTERNRPGDRREARQRLGIPADARVIGSVGRLVSGKKPLVLLEAFEKIGTEFPAAHLLIVGDGGEEADEVKRRAKASRHSKRIHLAGFQSDTRAYYHAMDVLAMPSLKEGLSNVVLEAMSSGVTVLAHIACGNREAVTNGYDGIIGEIDTADTLTRGIRNLLPHRDVCAALGRRARFTILKRFTVERMVADYAGLYREVAGVRATSLEQPDLSRLTFPAAQLPRAGGRAVSDLRAIGM